MTIKVVDHGDGTVTLSSLVEGEIEILESADPFVELSAYNVQDTSPDMFTVISPEFSLSWDMPGAKVYETGVDRGVMYLQDGSAVPWNGLVEVTQDSDKEISSVYYDGVRINELVNLGGFLGKIKAITYPDELVELEGMSKVVAGLYLGEQKPDLFHLCYRTRIGNDIDENAGYKIHILYNVMAVPSDKTYSTITDDPNIATFEWDITAIPEEVSGYKPTAHIVIDSRHIDPDQLAEYEYILYGSSTTDAALIPLIDFVNSLYYGYKWKVIDNGDGTWTAINPTEDLITFDPVDPDMFTLDEIDADYLSTDIYQISDTML